MTILQTKDASLMLTKVHQRKQIAVCSMLHVYIWPVILNENSRWVLKQVSKLDVRTLVTKVKIHCVHVLDCCGEVSSLRLHWEILWNLSAPTLQIADNVVHLHSVSHSCRIISCQLPQYDDFTCLRKRLKKGMLMSAKDGHYIVLRCTELISNQFCFELWKYWRKILTDFKIPNQLAVPISLVNSLGSMWT